MILDIIAMWYPIPSNAKIVHFKGEQRARFDDFAKQGDSNH